MNNYDRYDDALERDPLEAAALALRFACQCGSHNNCENWFERAVQAAAKAGVTLVRGNRSWPDINGSKAVVAAAQGKATV